MREFLRSDAFVMMVLVSLGLISWMALGPECKDLIQTIIGGIIGWWGKSALNDSHGEPNGRQEKEKQGQEAQG